MQSTASLAEESGASEAQTAIERMKSAIERLYENVFLKSDELDYVEYETISDLFYVIVKMLVKTNFSTTIDYDDEIWNLYFQDLNVLVEKHNGFQINRKGVLEFSNTALHHLSPFRHLLEDWSSAVDKEMLIGKTMPWYFNRRRRNTNQKIVVPAEKKVVNEEGEIRAEPSPQE